MFASDGFGCRLAIRTHELRRTVVIRMAEMGIDLDLVASLIGHETGAKDIRTLSRHYLRTDLIERKQKALEARDARVRKIIAGGVKASDCYLKVFCVFLGDWTLICLPPQQRRTMYL
jgi:hypothetical protein